MLFIIDSRELSKTFPQKSIKCGESLYGIPKTNTRLYVTITRVSKIHKNLKYISISISTSTTISISVSIIVGRVVGDHSIILVKTDGDVQWSGGGPEAGKKWAGDRKNC